MIASTRSSLCATLRAAAIVPAALLLASGCALLRPQPPRLQAVEAAPVAMPAVVMPTDEQFLIAKVADPIGWLDKATQWQQGLGCELPLDEMGAKEARAALKPGKALAAVVWSAAAMKSPAMSIVGMPLDPTSKEFADGVDIGEGWLVTTEEGPTPPTLNAETLRAQVSAPQDADVAALINMAAMWSTYGEMLRGQIGMLPMLLGSQPGVTPAAITMLQGELKLLTDGLAQLQTLGFTAELKPTVLEMGMLATARPDTAWDKLNATLPIAAPNLIQYLPAGGLMRMQGTFNRTPAAVDRMSYMMATLFGMDLSTGTLKEDIQSIGALGVTDYAQDGGFAPAGGMVSHIVLTCEHPEAFQRVLDETAGRMVNSGPMHEAYLGLGQKLHWEPRGELRRVKGWPVQGYKLNFELTDAVPADQAEMMRKMMPGGGFEYECVRMGRWFVISLGEPVDALLERVLRGPDKTAAAQVYPAGAAMHGEFNVGGMGPLFDQVRAMPGAEDVPDLNALKDAPPVSFALYMQQGKTWGRMQVPKDLIARIVAISKAKE